MGRNEHRLGNPKRVVAAYLSKTNTMSTFLVNVDFLVVDDAESAAGMGRGAHRARTPGQPCAEPPVLPAEEHRNVDVFLAN
eukprot:9111439-Pyramimonas_sp.AAC.1